MVDQLSPLAPVWNPGSHGNIASGTGVVLSELQPGSIVQVACWPGEDAALLTAIRKVTGLALPTRPGAGVVARKKSAFGIAPGRYLVIDEAEGLAATLAQAVPVDMGSVTDLSHGRTALRISGRKAEWVLSKLFALDFAAVAPGFGVSANHHAIFAQIQRSGDHQYDIYVFRSFSRSFWKTLCHAAEDTGFEVR